MARHDPGALPTSRPARPRSSEAPHLRQSVAIARFARAIARVLLAPLALAAAAVAGLVFVALLPVCGLASIAESISRGSWAFLRDLMSQIWGHPASRS